MIGMNEKPSPAKLALRRLLIILAGVVVLVIFSYGWSVTDINLDRPQEPQRQQNVGNALRELLSPNVLEQNYTIQNTTAPFLNGCPADGSAPVFDGPGPQPAAVATTEPSEVSTTDQPAANPTIEIIPACASSGDLVTVTGSGFYPDSLARINWITTDGERRIRQVSGSTEDNFITGDDGTFSVQIEVPRIRGSAGEVHSVEAQGRFPVGLPHFSDATGIVMEKMVETIFLALIATALSIVPSVILSFFAAHNLMRPVRMPLGKLLIGFALLPVGWLLGTALLGAFGKYILDLGNPVTTNLAAPASLLIFGMVTSSRLRPTESDFPNDRLRAAFNNVLFAVMMIVVLSVVAGLSIRIGEIFAPVNAASGTELSVGDAIGLFIANIPNKIGYFIGTIGELISLLIVPIAGIIGAFSIASIGMSLTTNLLKQVSVAVSHVLGGTLGAVSGAILLGFMAMIGMQAAWLGLLTPLVAGSMGGALAVMLYHRVFGKPQIRIGTNAALITLISWVGTVLVFVIVYSLLNVSRALVEGTLPPQVEVTRLFGAPLYVYVFKAMLVGALLGGLSGALVGTKAAFPMGEILYTTTRTILNLLRSIEPLIMGIVFIIWVGIGPFAGVLALTLHSIASLGKLFSEQIENIDSGPIEALQSTGANRLQTIVYAVVPQIVPPYIAFTMYRWDINVRMSTIIGFVGGGGIGFLLQQQINLLRYRDAGVAVLAIAVVVSVLDYASASIRERYV